MVAPCGVASPGVGAEFEAAGAPELVVPAVLELDVVPEPVLLEETDVPPENGFADPEPQPTIDARAKAATLNLTNTLETKSTKTPRNLICN